MTEGFKPYVMWIAAGIVLALFAVQRTGHGQGGVVVRLVHGAVARQYRPVWGGPGLAASADSPGRQPRVRPHLSRQPGLGPTVWWSSGSSCWRSLAGKPCMRIWGTLAVCRSRWAGWGSPTRASCSTTVGQGAFLLGHLEGGGALPDTVACLLCDLQCRGARDGTAHPHGESGDHGDHYREPGADLRRLLAHGAGHRAGLWRADGHYPHEHGTCGADLYAVAQLAALCRVCGADFDLSVQLAPGLGLWPGRLRRDALDLPGHDSAGRPALALERAAGQPALRRVCGTGGDVSPGQYA